MPRLKYDINSMIAFEESTGESFLNIANNKEKMMSFKTLRALYWAGTNPKASLEEAGVKLSEELKNGKTLLQLIDDITEALKDSFLISPEGEKENPRNNQKISE